MPEVLDKIGFPAEKLLKNLIKSVDATKKLYFSHRGVVTDTREVPDHDIQLRALIELAKMYGLYPRSSGRKSDNGSDGYSPPMINLVLPTLERANTKARRHADPSDHDHGSYTRSGANRPLGTSVHGVINEGCFPIARLNAQASLLTNY